MKKIYLMHRMHGFLTIIAHEDAIAAIEHPAARRPEMQTI